MSTSCRTCRLSRPHKASCGPDSRPSVRAHRSFWIYKRNCKRRCDACARVPVCERQPWDSTVSYIRLYSAATCQYAAREGAAVPSQVHPEYDVSVLYAYITLLYLVSVLSTPHHVALCHLPSRHCSATRYEEAVSQNQGSRGRPFRASKSSRALRRASHSQAFSRRGRPIQISKTKRCKPRHVLDLYPHWGYAFIGRN